MFVRHNYRTPSFKWHLIEAQSAIIQRPTITPQAIEIEIAVRYGYAASIGSLVWDLTKRQVTGRGV